MKGYRALMGAVASAMLWSAQAAAGPAAAEPKFERLVDDFLFGTLALLPTSATQSGYHRHAGRSLDDELEDYSPAGLAAQRAHLDAFGKRLRQFDALQLTAEQRADRAMIEDAIAASRLDLDQIQTYKHNPTLYVELVGNALYAPYVLHYAPAPERFAHIIERLRKIPVLLKQAQANLADAPDIWNTVARDENAGNIGLIDGELRTNCPAALRKAYDAAAATALDALKSFSTWLETTLSQSTSDWRLGKDKYADKFRYTLETGKSPETLLAEAEADFETTRRELAQLAAPRTVEQALADVAAQHASPATYADTAKRTLASASAFVRQKELLTLKPNDNLQVIDTPAFMRGVYSVGGFNPAPALEPQLGAFYWVTPIPADWPQARIDSKLREYNDSMLQHLTVHEAMPGHYVQAEYANAVQPRSRRLLRSIFGNGAYVEGWAVYTQQLMAEQGYQSDTPGYALTLGKQKLRLLANAILDIKLQTQGMTDQQALDLMMQGAYQEAEEARGKLQRAKLSSCQLPTYYAGFKGWLAVREDYRAKHREASLKQFHEAALREGAVPLPQLDTLLNP